MVFAVDRSDIITLISITHEADAIGQLHDVKTERDIFARIRSVTQSEWKAAGEMGLKPELQATIFEYDYKGEKECKLHGKPYGIYRTYLRSGEQIELYLEPKVGVTNV